MGNHREDLYETIGYYCWLIPSCISSILSLYVVFKSIKNKMTILRLLEINYCLGDILQCCAWFVGPLYTLHKNKSDLCSKQEIIFEVGLFVKTSIAVLVSGLFASYTISRENFTMSKIKVFFVVIILYTIISIILSYVFQSSTAGCEGILDHKYSTIDRYELSYMLFFLLPNGIFTSFTILFSFIGLYYRKDDLSSALLSSLYDRLYLTLFLVALCLVPCTMYFVMISFGKMNIVLYCITGIIISSTGTLFSCYHLYAPYLNKTKKANVFFFVEKLAEALESEYSGGLSSSLRSGSHNLYAHDTKSRLISYTSSASDDFMIEGR